jgi:hypothetical protein
MNAADQRFTKGHKLFELVTFFMHDLPRFGQLTSDGNTVSCLLQHGTPRTPPTNLSRKAKKKEAMEQRMDDDVGKE